MNKVAKKQAVVQNVDFLSYLMSEMVSMKDDARAAYKLSQFNGFWSTMLSFGLKMYGHQTAMMTYKPMTMGGL